MVGLEIQVRVAKEKRQEFLQTCDFLSQAKDRIGACVGQTLFEEVGELNRFPMWSNGQIQASLNPILLQTGFAHS